MKMALSKHRDDTDMIELWDVSHKFLYAVAHVDLFDLSEFGEMLDNEDYVEVEMTVVG